MSERIERYLPVVRIFIDKNPSTVRFNLAEYLETSTAHAAHYADEIIHEMLKAGVLYRSGTDLHYVA